MPSLLQDLLSEVMQLISLLFRICFFRLIQVPSNGLAFWLLIFLIS